MKIVINNHLYDEIKELYTRDRIADEIYAKFGIRYTGIGVYKGLRGTSKSYKLHYLICSTFGINIDEVFKVGE